MPMEGLHTSNVLGRALGGVDRYVRIRRPDWAAFIGGLATVGHFIEMST
jgi:hypothetical protein